MEEPDTDPEADWSIQEYPLEEKSGTLRWMLDKGFTVGKKILVTGFVLTSAPVVVPPLAVISLIGLASSVPLGIMWASYACTNKVMSKLLPLPEPSSLEYGVSSSGEDVKNGYFGGDIVEEAEEVPESVEMGIELLEKDEKNDYEEDIELMIQGLEEEAEKQPVVEINVVLDSSQDAGLEEDEEIARETTGLLEKIRDGEVNNLGGAEEGGLGMENPIEVEVLTETETEIIYDDNAGSEKPLTGIEITTDEAAGETPEAVYVETVDVVIPLEMERKPDQVGDFETIKESDEVLDAEKSSSEMSKTEEEQHKASSELEGQVSDIGVKYAQEDPDQLNKSEEEVTSTNADAKETADGRGLDAGNVALQHHSDADTVEGKVLPIYFYMFLVKFKLF